MSSSANAVKFTVYAILEVIILIVMWHFLSLTEWFPVYLSSPTEVFSQMGGLLFSGEIFSHMQISLYRSLFSFLLVAVIGTVLGILAGYFKPIGSFFDPLISFFNPVPKIALLPVFLVWFGVTDTTRILIIFTSAFFPAFIATIDGVRNIDKLYLWNAKSMGAGPFTILYKVVLPAAMPKIFDGLRVALALCFVMMFSSEMIGTSTGKGLGFLILNADSYGRTDIVLAAVLYIMLLGFLFDRLLILVRRYVLWWNR